MEDNSSNFKQELAAVDERIADLENQIELHKALERLHENEDFQKVVLDGYFEKESERIFGMLVTPSNLKRDQIENLMDMMSAIRNFKGYFKTTIINASMAPEAIEEEREYRKEITRNESIIDTTVEESDGE